MTKLKLAAVALCAIMTTAAFGGCIKTTNGPPLTTETIRIAVVNKGYGTNWINELCKAFKAEKGIDAQVVDDGTDDGFAAANVKLSPSKNNIDIFFPTENYVFSQNVQSNFVSGFDGKAWADLTDVYESPAIGYKELETNPNLKIKDIIDPYVYGACTYLDNRQYMVSYSTRTCGLLYNKKLWDETNAKPALNSDPLKLPLTTIEMDALFARIRGLRTSGTIAAYPYTYSGAQNYTDMFTSTWWAQLEGKEAFDLAVEGRYKNPSTGEITYSPQIFNTDGRLYAIDNTINLFKPGYTDPDDLSKIVTKAQLDFLQGKAFFNANGDWLEREAFKNSNPGDTDVRFMKLPVASQIVKRFPADFTGTDAANDEKLSGIIIFIDENINRAYTETDAVANGVSLDTLNALRDARKFTNSCEAAAAVGHVTSYSSRLESAKEFLKFMYSKKGQEVMMRSAFGMMCPIKVDITQFDYFNGNEATPMSKSKLTLAQESYSAFVHTKQYPMQYLGGLSFTRFNNDKPHAWTSASAVRNAEYNYWNSGSVWAETMSKAGV